MANSDREKARRMASRGATAAEIRQATGLTGEAARVVTSNWSPGAQAAAPPTVQQVRQATGTSGSQAAAIAARVAPAPAPQPSPAFPSPVSTGGGGGGGGGGGFEGGFDAGTLLPNFDAGTLPPNFVNEPIYDAAREAANLQMQKQIEELRDAGQTERQKLVNENNLAVTAAEVKGKLDLQGIINAGYKNIANIERGSNMFSSLMAAFNF